MTKQHFIALADEMSNFFATNAGREMDDITRGILVDHLARFCQSQNSQFMRGRWIAYLNGECGPNGGKKAA